MFIFCIHHNDCSEADLVDLHSVGILHEQEFTLCPDQSGDRVDQFGILAGLCWDL